MEVTGSDYGRVSDTPYYAVATFEEGSEDAIFMERHQPGTDAALLEEGYITCSLLSGLECLNESFRPAFDGLTGLFR